MANVELPVTNMQPSEAVPAPVKPQAVPASSHPWVGMNKEQNIYHWVLVGFRSWQIMLSFIQVIVSGVMAGAASYTSWWGYSYTNGAWLGVGIVALLFGLLNLAVSVYQLLLNLMPGWRVRAQQRWNANATASNSSMSKKYPHMWTDYTADIMMDVPLIVVWFALLIAAAATWGAGTAALSALLMAVMGTGAGLSWKLGQLLHGKPASDAAMPAPAAATAGDAKPAETSV